MPEVLLLDSPNSGVGDPTGTATFRVSVPRAAGEGEYQLVIRPSAADDSTKQGNPLTVNVLVRDTSFASKATPLPAPVWAGLALLAVALVARRRA